MDRSLKKATENLLAMKRKFGYRALQVRYQDMTKVVPILGSSGIGRFVGGVGDGASVGR